MGRRLREAHYTLRAREMDGTREGTGRPGRCPGATACWALLLAAWTAAAGAETIRVLFPVPGLVLTPGYDASPARGVQLRVLGLAPPGWQVWVAGRPADPVPAAGLEGAGLSVRPAAERLRIDYLVGQEEVDPGRWVPFTGLVELGPELVDLEVVGVHEREVAVQTLVCYYRGEATRSWAITVDDAADLLAELSRSPARYPSLFDHPALARLRRLHEQCGAVVSLYLFRVGTTYPGFDLSRMPARFQAEWQANADWLRLGFHGAAMLPPEPYAHAPWEQATADLAAVRQQVLRFAGEAAWDRFMRSHYWSGSADACQAWQTAGMRGFYAAVEGHPSYYLNAAQLRVVSRCDWWRDPGEDHLFAQTDLWVERDFLDPASGKTTSPSRVAARLDSLWRRPWASQEVQVFTHESLLLSHAASWAVPERLAEVGAWLRQRGAVGRFDADDPLWSRLPPVPPSELQLEPGTEIALVWSHRQAGCRYLVLRRDLYPALAPWVQVGATAERRFVDAWRPGWCAYRVVPVDAQGRRGGGSAPLPVRLLRNPDLDRDGRVGLADFFLLSQRVGPVSADDPGDLNGDGRVDLQDVRELGAFLGRPAGASALVPARP